MTRTLCAVAIGVLGLAPSVWAVEALTTEELVLHCDKYRDEAAAEDRTFCIRYIQGFIDGAVATDDRVLNSVADEYEKEETFSERAIRTRLGTRFARYGATSYAGYCLGDPVPLQEVVEHVVEESGNPTLAAAHSLAREFVYAILRSHYPCE